MSKSGSYINNDSEKFKKYREKINRAVENLKAGYSCSEAVLLTYSHQLKLNQDLASKIASGFGGGMGLMGETCGAVTAAYMVIGLKAGPANTNDLYSRDLTHMLVYDFSEHFKKIHGTTYCRDLTGAVDISTSEGQKYIREKGKVPQIVSDTIIILEEMFEQID